MMIRALLQKHGEILRYLVIGATTSLVAYGMYFVFSWGLQMTPANSSIWSDVVAIAVAYPLNKYYVFRKKAGDKRALLQESAMFFASRLIFLALSAYLMHVTVEVLVWPEIIARAGVMALVIVLNYIASRFFIFKKDGE